MNTEKLAIVVIVFVAALMIGLSGAVNFTIASRVLASDTPEVDICAYCHDGSASDTCVEVCGD